MGNEPKDLTDVGNYKIYGQLTFSLHYLIYQIKEIKRN